MDTGKCCHYLCRVDPTPPCDDRSHTPARPPPPPNPPPVTTHVHTHGRDTGCSSLSINKSRPLVENKRHVTITFLPYYLHYPDRPKKGGYQTDVTVNPTPLSPTWRRTTVPFLSFLVDVSVHGRFVTPLKGRVPFHVIPLPRTPERTGIPERTTSRDGQSVPGVHVLHIRHGDPLASNGTFVHTGLLWGPVRSSGFPRLQTGRGRLTVLVRRLKS